MHRRSMDGAWRVIGIENSRMYGLRCPPAFGARNFEWDGLCTRRIALCRFRRLPRIAKEGAKLVVLLVFLCWCSLSNQRSKWPFCKSLPISGCCLMSFLPALHPLWAAAKDFSHSFSPCRSFHDSSCGFLARGVSRIDMFYQITCLRQ